MVREVWKIKRKRENWNGRRRGGEIEIKRQERSDKKSEITVLPLKLAAKVCSGGRGQRAARPTAAELTYINLTENNVNYAANHYQGVEHIPGISKISLSKVECDIKNKLNKRPNFYPKTLMHLCCSLKTQEPLLATST